MLKKINIITLPILLLFISSCKKDVEELNPPEIVSARYQVTFHINWNSQDYPTDYPSNAHFSKLIGWSHTLNNSFFEIGSVSSLGIESMAENGATTPLDNELIAKIENNEGLLHYIGTNLGSGVGSITQNIEVTPAYPAVSLVTMIAPSPDWYLGAININLYEDGAFVSQKIVNGLLYDAGTDDGTTYSSANDDSSPKQPIQLVIDAPLGNGTTSPVIATVTFTKL